MRTLSVAIALSLGFAAAAPATVISMPKTLATACSESAYNFRRDWKAIDECSFALREEMMTRDARVATHVNRGILRLRNGDARNAFVDFDRAIALDPLEPEAWLNLSISQFETGNAEAARQSADRALQLRTRRPAAAYYIRGLSHEMNGNLNAAYADLQRARALEPGWSEPAMQLERYRVVR